jgi:hypothetical protein
MSTSFTQVFGGTTIYPSDVSYLPLALTGDISLEWPLEATTGNNVVARIIDVTPTGAYTITLPDAMSVGVGQTILFNNLGPSTVTIDNAAGNVILSIGAGQQWQCYLIDNTTIGGVWRTFRYGAAVAQAQAAALAGAGLIADGSELAQNYEVIDFSITPYGLTLPDRAKVFVWTGGLGTLTLPTAVSAGDGWFVQVRNGGQGDLTIDPSGSEFINAASTLRLQPGDSAVVVSDGIQWYTIGLGQQAVFAFDYTVINVAPGGTYTLAGSELNRIAYRFEGALTSDVNIVVPATVQQYWVNNRTTGSFTLALKTASGSPTLVDQNATAILYCDGTTIVAATTSVTFGGILPVLQGGTGANNGPSALTNLGGTGIGTAVFTAGTTAAARTAIAAAASGANSDITSLTGLTTPLSVPQGGTGAATLTANGVVLGNGASALSTTAVGTTGQVLVGNTGGAPSWATLTGIGVTSFSAGTTGLTPSTATTGVITLAGTLGVANGGTGTTTAFTAGSVVFAGASGVYSQDNANFFWDNTNDRLGIGTATPGSLLELAADGGPTLNMRRTGSDNGNGIIRSLGNSGTVNAAITFGGGLSNLMSFDVNGSERMRIDSSGNVGISINKVFGSGNGYAGDTSAASSATLELWDASGNTKLYNAWGSGSLLFGTSGTERMRITQAGNVGIGTITPAGPLETASDANSSIFASTYVTSTVGSSFIGQKARGTQASPSGVVSGDVLATWAGRGYRSTGVFSGNAGAISIVAEGTFSASNNPAYMSFSLAMPGFTQLFERMRIDSRGAVGFGVVPSLWSGVVSLDISTYGAITSNPGNPAFDIVFNAANNSSWTYKNTNFASLLRLGGGAFRFYTAPSGTAGAAVSFTEVLTVLNGGNVGIGTDFPGQKLTVAGTIETTSGGVKYPDATVQTTGILEQVDVYTTTGSTTWTKPSWAKSVEVILIGGGGGGASGRKGAAASGRSGGTGGGGAAYSQVTFQASALSATETVVVGAGGAGAAAQTTNSTNGIAGTAGGETSFGGKMYAVGGLGGAAGTTGSGLIVSVRGTFWGGQPGTTNTTIGGAAGIGITTGPGGFAGGAYGGGSGGGVSSADVAVGGGQGVNTTTGTAPTWKVGGALTVPANSVVTGNGNSGTNNTNIWLGGESGDGGGASTSGNAFNGGNGGTWGGGGGGGGAGTDSVGNSGAGGTGGNGLAVVISRG